MKCSSWKMAVPAAAILLAGCASTPPTNIGGDTYYAAKTNSAGIFGDVSAVAGSLMVEGNGFCAKQGRQFQLVTNDTTQNIPGVRFGGASITFRCIEHSRNVNMRPDKGVETITTQPEK